MNYTVTYISNISIQVKDLTKVISFRIMDNCLLAFNDGVHDIFVIPISSLISIDVTEGGE